MTSKVVLIATTKAPTKDTWEDFTTQVVGFGQEMDVKVVKQGFYDGPGCANYALEVTAEEEQIEKFANNLTMVLMPARWTFTEDTVVEGFHLVK